MKTSLSFAAGLAMLAGYVLFTLLAWTNFPAAYSPLTNWLSDLGSPQLNPAGAAFYNAGILLTGAAVLAFFLGLSAWSMPGKKVQRIMLLLTQVFGCLGALAMILSAVFPIHLTGAHAFWSAALYILLGTAFAFSVAALRYHPGVPRWLLGLGVVVALVDILWSLVLNVYIVEWITVGLFLTYVLLVGIQTRRAARASALIPREAGG